MPVMLNNKFLNQIPDDIMALLSSGQGLFETILFDENILWFWELHWQRLARSLHFFEIAEPSFDLKKYLLECINKIQPEQPTRIKLIYTFSFEDPPSRMEKENIIIQMSPERVDTRSQTGLQLQTQPSPYMMDSPLIGHKTMGYADLFYGRNLALKAGYDDVLFFNQNNLITETSYSNIFAVKDNQLFTPKSSAGIIPGTIRELFITNLDAQEGDISRNTMQTYDYFFVTSSIKGLRPVVKIDQIQFKIDDKSFIILKSSYDKIKATYIKNSNSS